MPADTGRIYAGKLSSLVYRMARVLLPVKYVPSVMLCKACVNSKITTRVAMYTKHHVVCTDRRHYLIVSRLSQSQYLY